MNPGMRMYLMTDGEANRRMATEDGKYQERGIGTDEQGYPVPYREPRPEFGENEARYRGEDGRWKPGTRRSEYEGGAQSRYHEGNEYGNMPHQNSYKRRWEVSVEPQNRREESRRMDYHTDPYTSEMRTMEEDEYDDPSGRVIGFGMPRNHYGNQQKNQPMKRGMHGMKPPKFDQKTAHEWVDGMENEDEEQPRGEKWDEAFLKPLAKRVGLQADGPEFWEFYAVVNALHSDYSKTFAEYNVDHPMLYAKLAKAWMHDKDAVDNKTQVYYECIVKPKKEEEGS